MSIIITQNHWFLNETNYTPENNSKLPIVMVMLTYLLESQKNIIQNTLFLIPHNICVSTQIHQYIYY